MSRAQAIQAGLSAKKTFASLAKHNQLKLKPNPQKEDAELVEAANFHAAIQADLLLNADSEVDLEGEELEGQAENEPEAQGNSPP